MRRAVRQVRRRRPGPESGLTEEQRYLAGAASVRSVMDQMGKLYRRPGDVEITPADGPVGGLWVSTEDARPGRTLLWLHGGAYLAGSPETHLGLATTFARRARAAVLLPAYRLAPEHRFPAAIDDALASYRWLLEGAGQDPRRLAVGGDSAGGGLALALAVAVREAGLPQPGGLVLLSPWTDLTGSGRSVVEAARRDPWVDASTIAPAGRSYAGDQVRHPLASPVFADLHDLAPMLLHAGSDEVLLDDARRVVDKVRATGGEASLGVFDGMFHVFQAFRWLPESRRSLRELAAFVRRVTTDVVSR